MTAQVPSFTRNQRHLAWVAFSWRRARVGGAVLAWKGTVAEAEEWIGMMGRRNFLASTFWRPKFVADSRTHAIGFTAGRVAVIQFEPSRLPPGRHMRFYQVEDLTVTSTTEGPFTAVYVRDQLFQVGHFDAEALRDILSTFATDAKLDDR